MQNKSSKYNSQSEDDFNINLKDLLSQYLSYWPYILVSLLIFSISALIYIRYATYQFISTAKIEIMDEDKSSEMALPTAMTIFNRSMINLDNEIGVLNSYSLHKKAHVKLKSNIRYFTIGKIKSSENHRDDFFENYELKFNINTDTISTYSSFILKGQNGKLYIDHYDNEENLLDSFSFDNFDTSSNNDNNLPFELKIKNQKNDFVKKIIFYPNDYSVEFFIKAVKVEEAARDSDQLNLTLKLPNRKIADEYLNILISEFDKDGINDRQLEYRRTIDFVDSRSSFLVEQLEDIETRKQDFKSNNKLTNIESDANLNITQKFNYDAELFSVKSQKDLSILLKQSLEEDKFEYMPVNIGIESENINQLISEYNILVKERQVFLTTAGPNNSYLKSLENQIEKFSENILISIDNYQKSLDLSIANLESKEDEFEDFYQNIPAQEKILRSIERELNIKESLFLLLLQKREEAAINLAVVNPSIKIIDSARSSLLPVSPNKNLVLMGSLVIGFILPIVIINILFLLDNKIHIKDQLENLLNDISVVGEIPHIKNFENILGNSRTTLAESVRMISANLNFIFHDASESNAKVILVTSSVKGEGKTLISTSISNILSLQNKKVLLIGADLRNPQIHKYYNLERQQSGLSDILSNSNLSCADNIIKADGLDILLSGTIPPNPTELLSSKNFNNMLIDLKKKYDYIIIDSAPCILVSDTLEISKNADATLYVVRSNFSKIEFTDFINECKESKKLNNINVVLNCIGSNNRYGYRYAYRYNYNYNYNYGYGYNYGSDESKN